MYFYQETKLVAKAGIFYIYFTFYLDFWAAAYTMTYIFRMSTGPNAATNAMMQISFMMKKPGFIQHCWNMEGTSTLVKVMQRTVSLGETRS